MSLIGLLFSSLIIIILGRFVSSQGKYVQIVSAVVHASFVDKLLGNAVRFLLISAQEVGHADLDEPGLALSQRWK